MNPTRGLRESWRGFAIPTACVLALVLFAWTPCQASEEAIASPTGVNSSNDSGGYRLAPGDKLKVIVFDQPQLSGDFTINGTGEIVLPLAGAATIARLTLGEAQQLIQERLADGILVHPVVSIGVTEYRPIFVTGYVRKPGNYPFIVGASVKAAIAVAGGAGEPGEQPTGSMSEAIMAKERVRQLETDRLTLLVRKARLAAQRDEAADFVMPQPVGFDVDNVEFTSVYSAENDTFLTLVAAYQSELKVLQQQRPRIEDEIHAVTDQIAEERDRLNIVSQRIDEYQDLVNKGLVRKPELTGQQIEKSLVQAEVSRLQGEIAHLQQNAGELEVKQEEVKANYKRQVLSELQETSQRLLDIDATLGTARQLRTLKAQKVGFGEEEPDYTIIITRTEQSGTVTLNAADNMKIEPGDVIEVKFNRRDAKDSPSPATEAGLNPQKAPVQREPAPVNQQDTLLVPAANSAANNICHISEPWIVGSGQHVSTTTPVTVEATEGQQATSVEGSEQQFSASPNVETVEEEHAISTSEARTGSTDLAPHAIVPGSLSEVVDDGHGTTLPVQTPTPQDSIPLPTRNPKKTFDVNAQEYYRALKGESKSADVRAIQQGLLYSGYSLTVDGRIGPQTLGAIADALAGVKSKNPNGDSGMPAQDLLVSGLQ